MYLGQACSDKLKREMKEFGYPPVFPEKEEKVQEESGPDPADPTKRVKKVRVSP